MIQIEAQKNQKVTELSSERDPSVLSEYSKIKVETQSPDYLEALSFSGSIKEDVQPDLN